MDKSNNNRNNIDSEQNTFQRLENDLKNTIFGVNFILLKGQEISIYTAFVLYIIQFLQITVFAFHNTVRDIWNADDITEVVRDIFGYFNIVTYLEKSNWDLYITFFYIGVVVLALAIIDAFYISYSYTRKKMSFAWPVVLLRNIMLLFSTIFFLPFLQYFLSVLHCVDYNGTKVHYNFTEIQCWTGLYTLHAIFAILGTIVFILCTLISSLTLFEYKTNPNDPTARVTSRSNCYVNLYQAVMIICLTFLTQSQFTIILMLMILGGSAMIFYKFFFNFPYHDEVVSKLWGILSALNLWTAFMLVIAKICENYIFDGAVIAWIIGLPLIVYLLIVIKDQRLDLLLINVNKFQSGTEVQNQIRYILKLIQWQSKNKNAAILLDGYMEIHKQSWKKDEDPQKTKGVKNNRFTKSLMNQDETLNEKYALLIQMLYKMYFFGIKKFPNNTSLMISYAFFLLEKMHTKQQALQELTQAETNSPAFDEQFIIYRYKKIIEDEIAESQNEGQGGMDVVSEVAFQTHLKQLQANIEKSSLLHMEFWSQLSEDNPDLAKLSDIGTKINFSVQYVEDNWSKLQKINASNTRAMRLYGKFLIEILNDKDGGDELLEKARNISNVMANKKYMNITGVANDEFNNEAMPTISISGEQDNYGIITSCNLQASSIFGYNKTELINRRVNVLMSQVFSKFHDAFLENYLNSGESAIIGKNKQRMVFGKNKSNYILPIYLSIKAVQSIIQGTQFITVIRQEKNFKNAAYILTTPDGTIDAMSSSCINLLKIDYKAISHKKANIQDYIPNIIKNRTSLFSGANNTGRTSATIQYYYPLDSEYLDENDETSITLTCHLNELIFLGGKEFAGLQFKFEYLTDKTTAAVPVDRKAKISNFQFKYEKPKPSVVGEYVDPAIMESVSGHGGEYKEDYLNVLGKSLGDNDQSLVEGSPAITSALEIAKSKQLEEEELQSQTKKIDFGVGIKTLRLFNGKPQEIEQVDPDEENEENEENSDKLLARSNQKQPEEDNLEDGSYRDFSTTFKSRKALSSVINDKVSPPIIRNLKMVINALCLILYLIAILDYVIASKEFDKIQKNIDLLNKSNTFLSEMMNVLSKTRDIYLLNIDVLKDVVDLETLKTDLRASLDAAQGLKQDLEEETDFVSTEHYNLFIQPLVKLTSKGSTTGTYKGLIQASEEIISTGYQILSNAASLKDADDASYYYITYNLLNDYYVNCRLSSEYYAEELVSKVNSKNSSFLLLLLGSAITLVVALIILSPILYQVNKGNEEVLSLFLDIPEKTVKGLYNKCETFISNLQVGEEDDIVSEIDEDELERNRGEDNMDEFIPRKKKKKFKNSSRTPTSFFVAFFLMTILVEAYFLYNYITSSNLLNNIDTTIVELNSTSISESFYSFANNAERQLLIDSNIDILGVTSTSVVISNIRKMYALDSLILQEHSINRKIHSDTYNDVFNQIMMVDPCPSLESKVIPAECSSFADSTVYQGMTVALTKNFENLRSLYTCYTNLLVPGGTCTITVPNNITATDGQTADQNKILSLLVTEQAYEIDKMQHLYIRNTFRILTAEFQSSLNSQFDSAITRRLIIFIVFLVAIFAMYIIAWLPLMRKISIDIWRTKSMLTMIPLDVISKIRSIRLYLKRYWNERNLVE